jgi:hypothetical protein
MALPRGGLDQRDIRTTYRAGETPEDSGSAAEIMHGTAYEPRVLTALGSRHVSEPERPRRIL